jgi:hypothetical protein
MVTGIGEVTMQMTADGYRGRRNLRGLVQWRDLNTNNQHPQYQHRLESVEGDYAGKNKFEIVIPIERSKRPLRSVSGRGNDALSWWDQAPGWTKGLLIVFIILSLLMCCCCILAGLFYGCFDRETRETITTTQTTIIKRGDKPPQVLHVVKTLEQEDLDETEAESVVPYSQGTPKSANQWIPEKIDVCFGMKKQPGTVAFYIALRRTKKEFGDKPYSVKTLEHVKNQLPDRKFFVRNKQKGSKRSWRQLDNKELNRRIKKEYSKLQDEQETSSETASS